MKREQIERQIRMNERVVDFVNGFNNMNMEPKAVNRLGNCQAVVYVYNDCYILCSYRTLVAAIVKATGEEFDFLRLVYGYTATSAQHIAKFFADYGQGGTRNVWRKI